MPFCCSANYNPEKKVCLRYQKFRKHWCKGKKVPHLKFSACDDPASLSPDWFLLTKQSVRGLVGLIGIYYLCPSQCWTDKVHLCRRKETSCKLPGYSSS